MAKSTEKMLDELQALAQAASLFRGIASQAEAASNGLFMQLGIENAKLERAFNAAAQRLATKAFRLAEDYEGKAYIASEKIAERTRRKSP
jgi:hypothetical protein